MDNYYCIVLGDRNMFIMINWVCYVLIVNVDRGCSNVNGVYSCGYCIIFFL